MTQILSRVPRLPWFLVQGSDHGPLSEWSRLLLLSASCRESPIRSAWCPQPPLHLKAAHGGPVSCCHVTAVCSSFQEATCFNERGDACAQAKCLTVVDGGCVRDANAGHFEMNILYGSNGLVHQCGPLAAS